jgi:oxygen-independent coproporphyrinogen-3 oxidase
MSGFGIYVHWPYCARICPYCDFNVYRARGLENTPLIDAISADIAEHGRRFGKREADSVFFGGGTPSLLSGEEIYRVLDAARAAFELKPGCEITLECNPEDAPRFAEHAKAGVNRFSIGAQAFDDDALKKLGRAHDAACARTAVEAAAGTGQRVSLDLIYAREGQSIESWRAELREALTLPAEHVSLYQLTIEPETAFARRVARGDLITPDNDEAAAFYEATQDICEAAGFSTYEISNHARSADARARHNLLYWRGLDWIGVGPGAHGRVTHRGERIATEAQRRPADYIDAVSENGVGWFEDSVLTGEQSADEALLMGLRLEEGVNRARIEAMRGHALNQKAIDWLIAQGLLTQTTERLALTRAGRVLTNRIVAELVT